MPLPFLLRVINFIIPFFILLCFALLLRLLFLLSQGIQMPLMCIINKSGFSWKEWFVKE